MDLILYNPLSNNNKSNIYTHKLIKEYKKQNIPFRIKSILKVDDIEEYLLNKKHIDNIILLGGDGTINRFVNEIAHKQIKQDIFLKSNGSGNDFLRSLKEKDDLPQTIMKAKYDNGTNTYFMNGVGMGIDGQITASVNSVENTGKFRYLTTTLKALLRYIPEPAIIESDHGKTSYQKVYLVTANNGKYFGGGMKITPQANINDDYLDVIIVHSIPKLLLMPIFFTIYLGIHTKFKRWVTSYKTKHLKVTFDTPQISQADGENIYDVTSMDISSSGQKIHLRYFDNK
jgi:diacylglycerol kinase family enzyme